MDLDNHRGVGERRKRQRNRAKAAEYAIEYRAKNRDRILEYQKKYREENKEKVKESKSRYKAANKEKLLEWNAKYREENRDKCNAASHKWREENKERQRELVAMWATRNPHALRVRQQNRRAKMRESGGRLSRGLAKKLFLAQDGKCACCGVDLGDNFNMDHIHPIVLGGSNTDDNIQLLTERCNKQKGGKTMEEYMQWKVRGNDER